MAHRVWRYFHHVGTSEFITKKLQPIASCRGIIDIPLIYSYYNTRPVKVVLCDLPAPISTTSLLTILSTTLHLFAAQYPLFGLCMSYAFQKWQLKKGSQVHKKPQQIEELLKFQIIWTQYDQASQRKIMF